MANTNLKQIEVGRDKKELKEHGSEDFPFLVSYERLGNYVSGSFFTHWHPEIEITLATEGQMLYKVNREVLLFKKGEVLVSNTNVLHSGTMDGERDCVYTSVTFHPRLVYGSQESVVYRRYAEPVLMNFAFQALHFSENDPDLPYVRSLVEKLSALDAARPVFYEIAVRETLSRIWEVVYRRMPADSKDAPHGRMEYERVKKMLDYIEQHYAENVRLSGISEEVLLCESECCRLFKRYMNMTIIEYLNNYRIDRSIESLADTDLSVTEIALMSGFSDPNYYSKMFSARKGVSPRKYRKRFSREARPGAD